MTAAAEASAPKRVGFPPGVVFLALWLPAAVTATFFALMFHDSVAVGDSYIPLTNDSFYHARRILDAAVGERGFYQFDDRLQVPEGTWISWPWAYDYLVAKATQLALWLRPGTDPMAFVAHVPVAWVSVNAALFLAAAGMLGLSVGMRLLAMVAFALSPLTQQMHAIGMVDHHYVEFTFVLLNLWLGLGWFRHPDDRRRAIAFGVALGLAPAFHNGLFMLQLMPLGSVFLLWLRRSAPPRRSLFALAAALLVSTQLVLLPSEPYWNGMFEFGLLSWFHFYTALCTAAVLAYFGWKPLSGRGLAGLVLLVAVLAFPLAAQVLRGSAFLSTGFSILKDVVEAHSVYRLFTATFGPAATAGFYSWLLLLSPLLLVHYGYKAATERRPERVFYGVSVLFGLALLLTQFRFHYYGLFALVTGALLIVDDLSRRWRWHRGAVFVAAFALLVLAYQPPLRERLFAIYPPGGSERYAGAMPLYRALAGQCARDPGVVLASNNDGSPILFHTECSVIANNFILLPQDDEKIAEVRRLMRMTPSQLRAAAPQVRYLFVQAGDFGTVIDDVVVYAPDLPLAGALFVDERPPEGFELVSEVTVPVGEGVDTRPYARLFRLAPPAGK